MFPPGHPMLGPTMFYLYHHHDLSRLADVLTVLRRHNTRSPLATDSVLVPNIGLGRWLKMHIAERDGISANISTALPAPFFWQLVADGLPGDRPDSSAYRRENLRWHLYALLPSLAKEVPEVGNYLTGTSLELRRWQLAERLADLFDQYLIYRREMLLGCERRESENSPPASSLSDLSDRSEPSGRARTVFHDFEAHSGAMQREIGEKWIALPTGAVDQSQVRQAARPLI